MSVKCFQFQGELGSGNVLVVLADGFCREMHNRCEILLGIWG